MICPRFLLLAQLTACVLTFFFVKFFIMSKPSQSGMPLRVHFVGRLEDVAETWERMQAMLTPASLNLSPDERVALIPAHVADFTEVQKVREHSNSALYTPFSEAEGRFERFTQAHVIQVCRRYIQDFVCFDMEIPHICIDHADLILDLAPISNNAAVVS